MSPKMISSLSRRRFIRRLGAFASAGLSAALPRRGYGATPKPAPKPPAFRGPASPGTPGTAAPWVARPIPLALNGVIRAPMNDQTGAKHSTFIHCPATGKMYVFGGDYSGPATAVDKANKAGGDDWRNERWTYDPGADVWTLDAGWDCGDGNIQPWRPDWGHFCWDTKRKLFWHRAGGSEGAYVGGTGSFAYQQANSSGLTFAYGFGRLYPDQTNVSAGKLILPDNATTRIFYDPTTHSVNLAGGQWPLYDVTTANAKIAAVTNLRPYWMIWGDPLDNIDPRHYANPGDLIYLDPAARKWIDPGFPRMEDQYPNSTTRFPDGRAVHQSYRNMSLVYDEAQDQLVSFGNQYVCHFSFATNKWFYSAASTLFPVSATTGKVLGQMVLDFVRPWFDPESRRVYFVETCAIEAPTKSYFDYYDVDAHKFVRLFEITDHQVGKSNNDGSGRGVWDANGQPAGALIGWSAEPASPLLHDAINDILWMVELENSSLNPYGYGAADRVVAMHAFHYKENPIRHERIVPPFDAANQPHGTVWGYDPINNLIMGYGQNAPLIPKQSKYYGTVPGGYDPVTLQPPSLYVWTPSGFTKS